MRCSRRPRRRSRRPLRRRSEPGTATGRRRTAGAARKGAAPEEVLGQLTFLVGGDTRLGPAPGRRHRRGPQVRAGRWRPDRAPPNRPPASLTVFGDVMRDLLDPRLRGRGLPLPGRGAWGRRMTGMSEASGCLAPLKRASAHRTHRQHNGDAVALLDVLERGRREAQLHLALGRLELEVTPAAVDLRDLSGHRVATRD